VDDGLQITKARQPGTQSDDFIIGMSNNNHRRPPGNLFIGRKRVAAHLDTGRANAALRNTSNFQTLVNNGGYQRLHFCGLTAVSERIENFGR
jgi:hypothetical protein